MAFSLTKTYGILATIGWEHRSSEEEGVGGSDEREFFSTSGRFPGGKKVEDSKSRLACNQETLGEASARANFARNLPRGKWVL
jgi:hypothetical protein